MVIVCEIAACVRDYSCVNKEREINNMCLQYCVSVTIFDLKVHKYNQWGGGGHRTPPHIPDHYHLYDLL